MTQHTAAEMREFAEWYEARVSDGYVPYRSTYQLTAAMLRQAADAMEAKPKPDSIGLRYISEMNEQ